MAATDWEIRRAAIGQNGIQIILCDDDPAFLAQLHSAVERTFSKLNTKAMITDFHGPQECSPEQLTACDMAFMDQDHCCVSAGGRCRNLAGRDSG